MRLLKVEEMKNKEKYAKEIVEIACSGHSIAIIKESGNIVSCGDIKCNLCLFYNSNDCYEKTRDWAESEYIEKPAISKRDRAFLEYLDANYYMARDLNGGLYVYISKPHKLIDCWESAGCEVDKTLRIFNIDFPMVKWEDNEPWLIEDLKKLEVVEEYEK